MRPARSLGGFGAQETIWAAVGCVAARGSSATGSRARSTPIGKTSTCARRMQEERATGRRAADAIRPDVRANWASSSSRRARRRPRAAIERQPGTHQDRLVKKLRRRGIADVAAANAFLAADVLGRSQSPLRAAPRHRRTTSISRVPRGLSLGSRLSVSRRRARVSNDWVVRYANRLLQLERQSHQPPARSTRPGARRRRAGQIEIRYRDRRDALDRDPDAACATGGRDRRRRDRLSRRRPTARSRRQARSADHPWHQAVAALRALSNLGRTDGRGSGCNRDGACGRCRSRGREGHAPTAPWKTPERVFHSAHKATSLTRRGHFY